jgi:hypothetical protein
MLFVVLTVALISSLLTVWALFITNSNSPSPYGPIHVKNEKELINAINKATVHLTIKLDKDITLTKPLIISANKAISLESNTNNESFFKLIGAKDQDTITVYNNGALNLESIIVTHEVDPNDPFAVNGIGVTVHEGGKLFMFDGEISGNHSGDYGRFGHGGGVAVYEGGFFEMFGGVISGNSCPTYGGGVGVRGVFSMHDNAVIANNTAPYGGGGVSVYVHGIFYMWGNAVIANNTATAEGSRGGGVFLEWGHFDIEGNARIVNNTADYGGGVYVYYAGFEMLGGEISNNFAWQDYGGVFHEHTFNLIDGIISGNRTNGKHANW